MKIEIEKNLINPESLIGKTFGSQGLYLYTPAEEPLYPQKIELNGKKITVLGGGAVDKGKRKYIAVEVKEA